MGDKLPLQERLQMVADGLIDRAPLPCELCGRPMDAGELVMCNDGYIRIYGEFVLGPVDDLHEDNWPSVHAECSAAADQSLMSEHDA